MRLLPILAYSLGLSGCLPLLGIGDGAFRVAGEVVSESGAPVSCELRLLGGSLNSRVLQTLNVNGSFVETFMVPPDRDTYQVDLFCKGKVVRSVTVKYGSEVRYATPVKIGRIVL